ncbi:porin family protein [Mariniflexile sp.]|uniref:porin family protein n=1 Tax=Mariniflexile sp. TaxID=1979402 RepID=UPI0035658F3F
MKNLLLVLLLSFASIGFSQEVKYGVRGGYSISNLDFEGTAPTDNQHRNSFYIGFFGDVRLSKTLAIVPELQFGAEGANEETLHLDYIQAPIIFKFRLSEKLRFGLGPQVGLKINKVDDDAKNMAYSGIAGIDFKLTHMLFADLRYTYGMTNVFDDYLPYEAKNTNIQIGVGYKF